MNKLKRERAGAKGERERESARKNSHYLIKKARADHAQWEGTKVLTLKKRKGGVAGGQRGEKQIRGRLRRPNFGGWEHARRDTSIRVELNDPGGEKKMEGGKEGNKAGLGKIPSYKRNSAQ